MEEEKSGVAEKRKRRDTDAAPSKSATKGTKSQTAFKETPVDGRLVIDDRKEKEALLDASVQKLLESDSRYVSSRWQIGYRGGKRQTKGKGKKAAVEQPKTPDFGKNGLEKWQSAQDRFPFVNSPSFRNCGLNSTICAVLEEELSFVEPTKVQQLLVPAVLSGQDVICGAERYAGKTTGYVIPIVQSLVTREPRLSREDGTRVVVLCQDRAQCEKTEQIFQSVLKKRGYWLTCSIFAGGENRRHEKTRLRKGVTIMITTEARLLDHLENTSAFTTEELELFVVDNASALLASRRGGAVRYTNQLLQERLRTAQKRRMQNVICTYGQHPDLAYLCNCMLRRPFSIGFTFSTTFENKWSAGALAEWKIEPPTDEPPPDDDDFI